MKKLIEDLEQLAEGLKIDLADKKVIKAFTEKKKAEGKKLTTDGKVLDGQWMGGNKIAEWKGGKIHFNDLGSKAAQTVQKALRKEAPKNWIAEDVELTEAAKIDIDYAKEFLKEIGREALSATFHMGQGEDIKALQSLQDVLGAMQSVVFSFGGGVKKPDKSITDAMAAISKAKSAILKVELKRKRA